MDDKAVKRAAIIIEDIEGAGEDDYPNVRIIVDSNFKVTGDIAEGMTPAETLINDVVRALKESVVGEVGGTGVAGADPDVTLN